MKTIKDTRSKPRIKYTTRVIGDVIFYFPLPQHQKVIKVIKPLVIHEGDE